MKRAIAGPTMIPELAGALVLYGEEDHHVQADRYDAVCCRFSRTGRVFCHQ